MTIRCILDGLLLFAHLTHDPTRPAPLSLRAYDGDEPFTLEALEAMYYEVVSATDEEILGLQRAHYRLLRQAPDFQASLA